MLQLDLSEKIAVVTGGSGELGRVTIRTLARCDAAVAIHYFRHQEHARGLREELTALGVRGMAVLEQPIADYERQFRRKSPPRRPP